MYNNEANMRAQSPREEPTINSLASRTDLMERMMHDMVQMMRELKTNQTIVEVKDSKMPDVSMYSGNSDDFSSFEVLVGAFFRNQPKRFSTECSKIDYIGTRLSGSALKWFTSFQIQESKMQTKSSKSFESFWERFSLAFRNPNENDLAENKLQKLKQGNKAIATFITEFETVRALTTSVDDRIDIFLRALSPNVRKNVLDDARHKPALKTDYLLLRSWLLQGVANEEVCSSSLNDNVIPMDLSMNVMQGKPQFKKMPMEKWLKFKEYCLELGVCPYCREYEHSSNCPKNKPSKEYMLSVIAESELTVAISIENRSLKALIDTGAQGSAFIRADLANLLKLRTRTRTPIKLRAFNGLEVETITTETEPIDCIIDKFHYSMVFLIANHMVADVILGFDWLGKQGLLIDCSQKRLIKSSTSKNSNWTPKLPSDTFMLCVIEQSEELIQELPEFMKSYETVFDLKQADKLPPYTSEHAFPIDIEEGKTVPQSFPYKLSLKEEQALRKEIEKGLESGKISPSTALGSCPVMFVKKPDKSLRMCIDYRKLNEITKSYQAILPNIEDILASLGSDNDLPPLYSKLDLKGAFNLLRIKRGCEPLTSFITKYGKYQYNVIPFGTKNAPGHFQAVMNKIFSHLIGRGLWIYIDDLLVYERDIQKHKALLLEILHILKQNNLVANLSKSKFLVSECHFLGFKLQEDGLGMLNEKVKG
jgi:predicted aspartyl protease